VRDGEPLENVARSCEGEGHPVIEKTEVKPRIWRLTVQRGG
jgi:hypothetical protein